MEEYVVKNGNNMPLQAPLIPDPFVPYQCPDNRTLNVICRTDRGILEKYLAPTPFEPAGDLYVVYVADFSNCDKAKFMDAGIIIPIRYGDRTGGYFLFEYEDNDAAIAAGRDLWGYPKKHGDIRLSAEGAQISGSVVRQGVEIMSVQCDLSQSVELPKLVTTPHFNIHIQPGPDGSILSKRIIERDTSPDFKLRSQKSGRARVTLKGLATDPLHELQPAEVLGANYIIGDFYATERNGWGRTIADLT